MSFDRSRAVFFPLRAKKRAQVFDAGCLISAGEPTFSAWFSSPFISGNDVIGDKQESGPLD